MEIDHEDGHPTAILVSISPAPGPGPDGKYYTVFVPIQDLLDLANADHDQTLVGHPWLDAPPESLIALNVHRYQHRRLGRLVERGFFIAIRAIPIRGKLSKGCRLDDQGQPIVKYEFSYRRPEKYLTKQQLFWLRSVAKQAQDYTDQYFAAVALGEFFQALAAKVARAPRPKKPKLKAKERRRLQAMGAGGAA